MLRRVPGNTLNWPYTVRKVATADRHPRFPLDAEFSPLASLSVALSGIVVGRSGDGPTPAMTPDPLDVRSCQVSWTPASHGARELESSFDGVAKSITFRISVTSVRA